jgi:hypothetical protein
MQAFDALIYGRDFGFGFGFIFPFKLYILARIPRTLIYLK